MTMDIAGEVILAALALRVFGRDAVVLLRRLAAAGVRAGISEMRRDLTEAAKDPHHEGQAS
ncbi:hypothetical protein ACFY5C_06580 [Streptomyces sp. NPDC012935]|uniref:hypothetical protein n=1 Tax=Streptomyces sp. NPDC012935 TaxID=3364857 RepID=UPI0036AB2894